MIQAAGKGAVQQVSALREEPPPAAQGLANSAAIAETPPVTAEPAQKTEPSQESPRPAAKETFDVEVQKAGDTIGLDLSLGKSFLRVTGVTEGPIQKWNALQPQDSFVVREGDCILNVNGVSGDPKRMLELMQNDSKLKLVVQPRVEFMVIVPYGAGTLGLQVNAKKRKEGLIVVSINDGLIKSWNDTHAGTEKVVREQDRIIEINGHRSEPKELLEHLKKVNNDNIEMRIVAFN